MHPTGLSSPELAVHRCAHARFHNVSVASCPLCSRRSRARRDSKHAARPSMFRAFPVFIDSTGKNDHCVQHALLTSRLTSKRGLSFTSRALTRGANKRTGRQKRAPRLYSAIRIVKPRAVMGSNRDTIAELYAPLLARPIELTSPDLTFRRRCPYASRYCSFDRANSRITHPDVCRGVNIATRRIYDHCDAIHIESTRFRLTYIRRARIFSLSDVCF